MSFAYKNVRKPVVCEKDGGTAAFIADLSEIGRTTCLKCKISCMLTG